jgi:hypothetical protein
MRCKGVNAPLLCKFAAHTWSHYAQDLASTWARFLKHSRRGIQAAPSSKSVVQLLLCCAFAHTTAVQLY